MKKTLAVLLALALFAAIFAACGAKPPANEILLADMLRDDIFDTIYVELELAGLTKEQKQELTGLCTQQLSEAYGSEVEVILYFAEDDPDGTLRQEMRKCPNIVCAFPDQEQVDKSQLDLVKVARAIVERIIAEIDRVLATLGRPAVGCETTAGDSAKTLRPASGEIVRRELDEWGECEYSEPLNANPPKCIEVKIHSDLTILIARDPYQNNEQITVHSYRRTGNGIYTYVASATGNMIWVAPEPNSVRESDKEEPGTYFVHGIACYIDEDNFTLWSGLGIPADPNDAYYSGKTLLQMK